MVGFLFPVILHDIGFLPLDDTQPPSSAPLASDGAVTLPDQIIIFKGICLLHLQISVPSVTVTAEQQCLILVKHSQSGSGPTEADLLPPGGMVVELKCHMSHSNPFIWFILRGELP